MRSLIFAGLMLAASFALSGQTVFDAASIKPSPRSFKPDDAAHTVVTPGGVSMFGITLQASVEWAYGIGDEQVSGPAWLGTERYDIVAKAGDAVPVPELRLMMQALLADRFGLVLHHESKERAVFVIAVGEKGPKLARATEAGTAEMKVVDDSLVFDHFTLAEIAERLSVTLGRPVLDWTGIAGEFNVSVPVAGGLVDMKMAAEQAALANLAVDASPYSSAFRRVGLKLEAKKAPVDVIVIDHAERVPKAN